jgi:hypothetical protein
MWRNFGIELMLNDRRRPQASCATGARTFVRHWWMHSRTDRRRPNERYPVHPGNGRHL